jgi:hypothetical protein
VAGSDRPDAPDDQVHPAGVLAGGQQGGALGHLGPGPAGQVDQGGVEIGAPGDHGVQAPVARQGQADRSARG